MLLDDTEIVGFALIRVSCLPLTRVPSVQQEVVFVRADKRSQQAEMLLHLMTIENFKGMSPNSEIGLLIGASSHAAEVITALRNMGLRDAALRMTASRAEHSGFAGASTPETAIQDASSSTKH